MDDSHVSRRFPPWYLKIGRGFTQFTKNWLRQHKGYPGCVMGQVGKEHRDVFLQKRERILYKLMLIGVELS